MSESLRVPGVVSHLILVDAFCWVYSQETLDEVFELVRSVSPLLLLKGDYSFFNHGK